MYYTYCFTNKVNGKSYVGLSKNPQGRRHSHKSLAKRGSCHAFHNAIRKYGIDSFQFVILESQSTLQEANEAETFYISLFGTLAPSGYNMTNGGDCSHRSKESYDKISGDRSSMRKLDSITVQSIYKDYVSNTNLTCKDLALKYNVCQTTIKNVLRRRTWKNELTNYNPIDHSLRGFHFTRVGDNANHKTITSVLARQIYQYRLENEKTIKDIASLFGVSVSLINQVLKKKTWKDSTKDLPDLDLVTSGYRMKRKNR